MKSKVLLTAGLLTILLISCSPQENSKIKEPVLPSVNNTMPSTSTIVEEYRTIDQFRLDALNEEILSKGLKDEQSIMQLYTPKDMNASNSNYTYDVSTNVINDSHKEVTLISENFQDDSTNGLKVIMTVEKVNDNWKVTNIKESYKCQLNRGQQTWAASLCT